MLWVHSLYGADANHLITTARLGMALPLGRLVQLGRHRSDDATQLISRILLEYPPGLAAPRVSGLVAVLSRSPDCAGRSIL
jgi:hypothetical protein